MQQRKRQMFPDMEQRIAAELSEDSELCPMCGMDWVIPNTTGHRHGVCPHCYAKAKTAALRGFVIDNMLKRDYDCARAEKCRAQRRGDVPAVNGASLAPDFDHMDMMPTTGEGAQWL